MNPYKNSDLRSFLDAIPPEEIEKHTKEMFEESDRQHKEFLDALTNGKCYLCGKYLNSFDENNFCLHWFTYPTGIKKKYFEFQLNNKEFGFTRVDSYFRWLAETDKPIANISDLKEEMSQNSFYEATIKYKNIEWSFSIGTTDLEGHKGSKVGEKPHYHIQMKVDEKFFIRFNDLHILFTDADLFNFELLKQNSDRMKYVQSHGEGISILENPDNLEMIDEFLSITDDDYNSTFFTSTLIEAPEGQTISGDLIYEAYQKSKETSKPISHFLKDLIPEASMIKIIYPGEGVPEIAKRSGKK